MQLFFSIDYGSAKRYVCTASCTTISAADHDDTTKSAPLWNSSKMGESAWKSMDFEKKKKLPYITSPDIAQDFLLKRSTERPS